MMPKFLIITFALLLSFASATADEGKRITTEKEFREQIVDRELTGNRTILQYISDGRMVGMVRGQQIEGKWDWTGTTVCRTATVGSRTLGHDCIAIFVIGDLVVIVRDEGRGKAFALRFRVEGSQQRGPGEFLACVLC